MALWRWCAWRTCGNWSGIVTGKLPPGGPVCRGVTVPVAHVGQPFQAAGERGFPAPRPGGWKAALTGRLESLPYLE